MKSEEARGRNGFWLDEERWKGINQVDHSHIDGCRQALKGGATPKDLNSAIVVSSDNLAAYSAHVMRQGRSEWKARRMKISARAVLLIVDRYQSQSINQSINQSCRSNIFRPLQFPEYCRLLRMFQIYGSQTEPSRFQIAAAFGYPTQSEKGRPFPFLLSCRSECRPAGVGA